MAYIRFTLVIAGISLLGACGTYSEMTTESGEEPALPVYSKETSCRLPRRQVWAAPRTILEGV